jgi:hypothetical protein
LAKSAVLATGLVAISDRAIPRRLLEPDPGRGSVRIGRRD